MHATHGQVFGLASMVNFWQRDTTCMLPQVRDQPARRSPAGFGPASIVDFGLTSASIQIDSFT